MEALRIVQGAFSLMLLTPEYLLAARDPHGFRPLCIGRVDGSYVVASETCAFDLINAEYVRDVEPGEVVRIEENSLESQIAAAQGRNRHTVCSSIFISAVRTALFSAAPSMPAGGRWARISRASIRCEADVVVPVPDSGVSAAIGYSQESGIPLEFGLIRNHYVGRTFIEPKQSIRNFGVKIKLNPVREILRRQAHRA